MNESEDAGENDDSGSTINDSADESYIDDHASDQEENENEVRYLDTPEKSMIDPKQYRVIQLSNNLKALLITDPRIDSQTEDNKNDDDCAPKKVQKDERMASCALSISVGSCNDPPEIPGLARLLKHMILIASDAQEAAAVEFDGFVKSSDGYVESSIDNEQTTFKFTVLGTFLRDALERFAQFFIDPRFEQNTIRRVRQFIIGRADVTDEELLAKLQRFTQIYYRGRNMNVTIEAALPLDTLEEYVKDCFSNVPNDVLPATYFTCYGSSNCFPLKGWGNVYVVSSFDNDCKMELVWSILPLRIRHKPKPLYYVSWLLCHMGKGSLMSDLWEKMWVTEISSDFGKTQLNCSEFYDNFTLSLVLTEEGYKRWFDVVEVVYSYINTIRSIRDEEAFDRIYEEINKVEEAKFKWSGESASTDPFDLCKAMHSHNPKDYVKGNRVMLNNHPRLIQDCLDQFSPNCVNTIIYRKFVALQSEVMIEHQFDMNYSIEDSLKVTLVPENTEPSARFHLPEINVFLANDFTVLPLPNEVPEHPTKIFSNEMCEIWQKLDSKFRLPKCYLNLHYISSLPLALPQNAAMLDLYVEILEDLMFEELYPATVAGLDYQIQSSERGLLVEVNGFNEKLNLLVDTITKYMMQYSDLVTEQLFDKMKAEQCSIYDKTVSKSDEFAEDVGLSILKLVHWTTLDKRTAMLDIGFVEFQQFAISFTDRMYVQCLAQGNMEKVDVIQIVLDCVATLGIRALHQRSRSRLVTRALSGAHCCRIKNVCPRNRESAVRNYYQVPDATDRTTIEMLNMFIEDPLFDQLSNLKQLNFCKYDFTVNDSGVSGYSITGLDSDKNVDEIDKDIETFRQSVNEILREITVDQLLDVIKSINANQFTEKSFKEVVHRTWAEITAGKKSINAKQLTEKSFEEDVHRNWAEIATGTCDFNRLIQENKTIDRVLVTQVLESMIKLTSDGTNTHKLSIQVVGSNRSSVLSTNQLREKDGNAESVNKGPAVCGKTDLTLEYLTDLDSSQKKPDGYYITDLDKYKDSLTFAPNN